MCIYIVTLKCYLILNKHSLNSWNNYTLSSTAKKPTNQPTNQQTKTKKKKKKEKKLIHGMQEESAFYDCEWQ